MRNKYLIPDLSKYQSYDKYFKLHECPPNRKDISILDIQYENKIVDHDENIDTELTIDIFDTYSKPLGKTDNYGLFVGEAPACLNGQLIIEKEGYALVVLDI